MKSSRINASTSMQGSRFELRLLIAVVMFYMLVIPAVHAEPNQWIRAQSIVFFGDDQWLVADATTGELSVIDTALNVRKVTFPGKLREPIALARDGVGFWCFDRSTHQLLRINRRFELVNTIQLPEEYRLRLATCLTVTNFGEILLIDRDRNDLLAFDLFGREAWRVSLPESDPVKTIVAARDSVFILFDNQLPGRQLLAITRYGAGRHWVELADTIAAKLLAPYSTNSYALLTAKALYTFTEKQTVTPIDIALDQVSAAAVSESHIALIASEGVRIIRWR